MDEDFDCTEGTNDATVQTKCPKTRQNDASRSRGCVFLTDYSNRLRHRLLLQQLEVG